MKNLFKIKRPHRSNEIAGSSVAAASSQSPSLSTSCNSDSRAGSSTSPGPGAASDATPPIPSPTPGAAARRGDYFTSEEEFQIQLALALSASSNSDFGVDPDGDQIRAAKLISLGQDRIGMDRDASVGTAESLSRRYWDYNVLDYHEKVIDGFYDVFGISTESSAHGKMPSLAELQTSIGDLGYEVIVINRAIDTGLGEMEQIAHCISLDCPVADIALLVQRIAELVSNNMGGRTKDANDMVARWTVSSTELRTSLQTSLLPIGCIKTGLSRHRALLFKILADHVGISCKLVKGSLYTGCDDDAVNIIKSGEREFLVDLMVDPGTLIPADAPTSRAKSSTSVSLMSKNLATWSGSFPDDEMWRGNSGVNDAWSIGQTSESSIDAGRSTGGKCSLHLQEQSSVGASPSEKNDVLVPSDGIDIWDGYSRPGDPQDTADAKALFADLNPFHFVPATKNPVALKASDDRYIGHQKQRENAAAGPGKAPQPLVLKNWTACNEASNNKQKGYAEGSSSHVNVHDNVTSPIQVPPMAGRITSVAFGSSGTPLDAITDGKQLEGDEYFNSVGMKGLVLPSAIQNKAKAHKDRFSGRDNQKKIFRDRNTNAATTQLRESISSSLVRPPRLDLMLEDVSECEILWEDLVIGERIGLGSYGEVYRAEWNGMEVAVKKFLDQDFYGVALGEFRSEVRIMRRLEHSNVVLFMGAVTRPPNLSIVSEYLPRGSLYKILHRPNCQIDEKLRIKMALDVAKGMNCLHTSVPTIVHRDLKSPNLLVDENWTVKVGDFGLSRLKHSTFLSSKSTAGTPEWMAPEVLRNEPSNEKCDIYSFGVILWELATLRMPWAGMNPMQVVGAVGFQERRLEIPKEVDPMVGRIIWECWQTDPSLRPTFAQLTTALQSLERLVIPSHQETHSSIVPQEISVNSSTP